MTAEDDETELSRLIADAGSDDDEDTPSGWSRERERLQVLDEDTRRSNEDSQNRTAFVPAWFLALAGVFFVLSGLGFWLAPAAVLQDIVTTFQGYEDLVRYGVAGVLLGGLFAIRFGFRKGPTEPLPAPESARTYRVEPTLSGSGAIQPGIDVDQQLSEMLAHPRTFENNREEMTANLRGAVEGTLTYYEDVSDEEAEEMLETGAWTDDEYAASLFLDPTEIPFRIRFSRWLSPRETYRKQVDAVIEELRRLTGDV